MNTLIHNRFDIVVRDARTEKVIEKHTGYNIILNTFWANYLTANHKKPAFNCIQFGSGTSSPVATDTALGSLIGGKNATIISADYSNLPGTGVMSILRTIRIEADEFVGANISEVGMATSTGSGLCTKSLLKDANGNAISIAKPDSTIIDIYATFFAWLPESIGDVYFYDAPEDNAFRRWVLGDFGISQYTTIDDYVRFWKIAHSSEMGIVSNGEYKYQDSWTFDPSQKKMTMDLPNMAAGVGNIGGISGISAPLGVLFKIPTTGLTSPTIVKEVVGTGDGVKTGFNTTFGRIINKGNNKIYVNDVEASGTFNYRKTNRGVSFGTYMMQIKRPKETLPGNLLYKNMAKELDGANRPLVSVTKLGSAAAAIWGRNSDGDSWVSIGAIPDYGDPLNVPSEHQNYNYYCIQATPGAVGFSTNSSWTADDVVLSSPPSSGATVAVTYDTDCIPKTSDSVFNNISLSITFAEYTP